MKLQKSKKYNINYLSKIINIKEFTPHPNPEVTRMKVAHIDGYSICVGIDEPPGLYVYFPTMSQINSHLLSYLNLYSDKSLNSNPEAKCGFFGKNGRVKAIKLKGFVSEGFLLPFNLLQSWILSEVNVELPIQDDGLEFDEVEHNGKTFWISKKYRIRETQSQQTGNHQKRRDKKVKRFDKIREDQFHFHYDTIGLRKVPTAINPDDLIQISSKWDGCVDGSTLINCSDGLIRTIKEIVDFKLEVEVEAYDINTRQKVFVPIDEYYCVKNSGEWFEIELENGQKLKITGNNPIWLPELNCYRKVDELIGNECVLIS